MLDLKNLFIRESFHPLANECISIYFVLVLYFQKNYKHSTETPHTLFNHFCLLLISYYVVSVKGKDQC